MRGEYEGVTALHRTAPGLVPKPVGWGTYTEDKTTHFYLCEFVKMIDELPDMPIFCERLAQMHKDSIASSPKHGFGFHVVTYEGNMYQDVTRSKSWEKLYSKAMRAFVDQERQVHGDCEDLDKLLPLLFTNVIPRLLRPLQTEGRSIRPVLVHGDIWYGNLATNTTTGDPIMFDPSLFWAHNECKYIHPLLEAVQVIFADDR